MLATSLKTTPMNTEPQFRNRLNSLLEGIQLIDYDWRYVYLNDVTSLQSKVPKEELLGRTMMEAFPGIEDTPLFEKMRDCMINRQPHHFENHFIYPDQTEAWFELSIQPAEEGICILSIDITNYKLSEQKIAKGKALYSFLSHINQSIVHLSDQESLFSNACKIAIEFGKFKLAWIALFDDQQETMTLAVQCGSHAVELPDFSNAPIPPNSLQRKVIDSGLFHSCGDVETEIHDTFFRAFAERHDILSFIILPLRKSGKIIGTFNLYSEKKHFIGNDEILLLDEVTGDISFALHNFEKEKKHRETEQILVANEKRFRALIEKSADMKTMATADGQLFYGSPAIAQILGHDLEKMIDTSLFTLIHPDDLPEFVEKRNKLLENPGSSFYFEVRMKHAHDGWVWCAGSATNMLEESGVHAVVSNFMDISQKKFAEQQMDFDRENTNALINNTKDLMWSIDNNFKLITSNRAFQKAFIQIYGKALEKGDKILHDNLSPENRARFESFYQRAFSGETFTETVPLNIGEINWSEISFHPITNEGKIIGTACYSRDITNRINTKMELEKQNRELIKTNFELDRFVYSVSHDLRSPLTSILGLVNFIEEESQEDETLLHAAMIRNGINRLDSFIKNILSYSRNNRIDLEITQIPVTKTIQQTIASLRNIRNALNIDFRVAIDERNDFYSDRQGFQTIMENLISNAIKFHNRAAADRYISVTGHVAADQLELTVEDNGIGIEAEHLERIFEMFFRATAHIDGSGIGLYIVREIVTKLEGTITVTSEPGKGTQFHIRLKNQPL